MLIIVMGVSGCGKSTIGKLLADQLNIDFYDADDFHPDANVTKMKNGQALNDTDRKPWLLLLSKKLQEWQQKGGAVLACSALKENYRQLLMSNNPDTIKWVYLEGTFKVITERISKRENHFMKADLLKSQFDTLEIPEYGSHISITNKPSEIITTIIEGL